jgi:hypothetical protein
VSRAFSLSFYGLTASAWSCCCCCCQTLWRRRRRRRYLCGASSSVVCPLKYVPYCLILTHSRLEDMQRGDTISIELGEGGGVRVLLDVSSCNGRRGLSPFLTLRWLEGERRGGRVGFDSMVGLLGSTAAAFQARARKTCCKSIPAALIFWEAFYYCYTT